MSRHKAYPPHVGTIGGTIRIGHGLILGRENRDCRHRATFYLLAIAERYGAELALAAFMARAVSSECGARWPNLDVKIWVANSLRPAGATPRRDE